MSRVAFLFLVFAMELLLPGCGVAPREKSAGGVSISRADLVSIERTREALAQFANRYVIALQGAASAIVDSATDVNMRRDAVLWELFAAEQGRDAVFQRDVVVALLDIWILCVQMREFFEAGQGRDVFGEHTTIALNAAKELEADIGRVSGAILPADRGKEIRDSVQRFAAEHPIRFPFSRDSDVSFLHEAEGQGPFNWIYDASLSPLRAIGGMDETALALFKLADVASQSNLVANYLPRQLRLQTQLLLYEPDVQSALANMTVISESADRMSIAAKELPEEVSNHVEKVLTEVKKHDEVLQKLLARLTTFLADLRNASVDVGRAGAAWEETTKAIHDMVRDFRGPEEGKEASGASIQPAVDTAPAAYDINDYSKAAREVAQAAVELRGATAEVKSLLTADTPAVTTAAGEIEGLVNRVALYGVVLILAFFGGLIAYRVAASRLSRSAG